MELRSIELLFQTLNDAQIHYLVVGGLAVNAHGYMRATRDVDIVIQLEPLNAQRGLEALLNAGWKLAVPASPASFADASQRESWQKEKHMIVLKLWSDEHQRTPIDVFIYEPFDFCDAAQRAVNFEVGSGVTAPFVPLDILLGNEARSRTPAGFG